MEISMDKQMAFATLNIAETRDERVIKDAYRRKLTVTNPEDHPEEFKLLREAYERALAYINESSVEQGQEDNSPVGLWMRRVNALYISLSARQDRDKWKSLLKDDICLDLDYGEEAKWRLFGFLAEHYQLRADIWRLLNEEFHIVSEQDKFKEHLPVPFVDFILGRIADTESAQDFPYEWLSGADDADYDDFQGRLYELEGCVSNGQTAQAEPIIAVMERSGIDHPYFQLAKAQLLLQKNEESQAAEIAVGLMSEDKYKNNLKIQALASEVLYKCGEREAAETGFRYITENFGRVNLAEKYLTFIERDKNNIIEAIDHCLAALDYYNDEELQDILRELDNTYLESVSEDLNNGTLADESVGNVVNAFLRSGRADRGLYFFESYPEYKERIPEVHQLLAMLYYKEKKYEECIEEAEVWRDSYMDRLTARAQRDGREPDGGEIAPELSDIYNNLQGANNYIGSSYISTAHEIEIKAPQEALEKYRKEGVDEGLTSEKVVSKSLKDYTDEFDRTTPDAVHKEEKKSKYLNELYENAMEAYKKAVLYAPDNLNLHQQILEIYFSQENYAEALKKADEIIAMDSQWFPAYVRKQQACFELGFYQDVIDVFYQAKKIYAGFEQIYRLAVRTFNVYEQYGDAKRILEQAREAGVTDGMLEVLELRVERLEANKYNGVGKEIGLFEVYKKAIALLKSFLQDENVSRLAVAELYYELAFLETQQPYAIYRHPGKEIEYTKKAMALNCFAHEYEYLAAYIFHKKKNYDAAVRMYDMYLRHYPYHAGALLSKGGCHEAVGAWKLALETYERLLENNPKHREVNAYIARVYRDRFDKTDKIEYGEKAIEYWNAQIVNTPEDYQPYLDRGLQLINLNRFEEALADAEEVWKREPKNPYGWNLKGKALMYMGKYQQAIFHFKKAMEYMDKPALNGGFLYEYTAFCYLRSMKPEYAEKWYRKEIDDARALDKDRSPYNAYDNLRRLYHNQERYDEGVAIIREAYERKVYTEERYRYYDFDMRTIPYLESGRLAELLREAEEIANHYNELRDRNMLAMILLYAAGDVQKAVSAVNRAVGDIHGDSCSNWRDLIDSIMIYYCAGESSRAAGVADIIRNSLMKQCDVGTEKEAVEMYIASPEYGRVNLCVVILYYICSGRLEEAGEYIRRLKEVPLCRDCKYYKGCFETSDVLGMYYEALGENEKALEHYRNSYNAHKDAGIAMYKLRQNGRLDEDM